MSSEKRVYDEESGASAGAAAGAGVGEGDKGRKFFEMGTSSNSRSFEVESWAFVPTQNYSLQLMQRVEPPLEGDVIPATDHETLAFFRVYTSTVEKTQKVPAYVTSFNSFVWNCVFSSLKSLPYYYIQLFLSSYVPHKHMYIPAMMPLMFGYNLMVIVITWLIFIYGAESTLMLLYYGYVGVTRNGPWDRCDGRIAFIKDNKGVICLESDVFRNFLIMDAVKESYHDNAYYVVIFKNESMEFVIPAPVRFFRETAAMFEDIKVMGHLREAIIYAVILLTIGLCHKQIYRRIIWQIVNYLHWILNLFYLGAVLHILVFSLETKMNVFKTMLFDQKTDSILKNLDFDFFADTVGVPPVLHFIASRRNNQVNPAADSGILVFSNSVNYFIKGLSMYLLKRYCEHQYNIPLLYWTGVNNLYYLWPLYLKLIPLGDFLGCIFFFVQGVTEFSSFVIAYNIAMECVQSTYPKFKWWIMLIITLPWTILIKFLTNINFETWTVADEPTNHRRHLYPMVKAPVLVVETLAIVWLYPIARLQDDITFHTGSPPPKVLSVAIRILPLYLGVKCYLLIFNVLKLFNDKEDNERMYYMRYICYIIATLAIGMLYAAVNNLCIKKQNWRALLRPVPTWGPTDHIQRQLRKQFDSREYIASTASRYLSRYLKSKLTARTYRLDVSYETERGRRRSTIAPQFDSFRYDDEKKKDV